VSGRKFIRAIVCSILAAAILSGCGGMRPTVFINEQYDFRFLERVAVIPFDNLSNDQGAGNRATRLFISKILSERAFDVVEPGEVSRVLEKYATVRTGQLTEEQIKAIGQELKVQGIILGTVTESSTVTGGGTTTSTITIVARMVETEKGTTVWSATNTAGGRGFWGTLFGTGGNSQSEATRKCVDGLIKTLVK
jgi:TolB-like protein